MRVFETDGKRTADEFEVITRHPTIKLRLFSTVLHNGRLHWAIERLPLQEGFQKFAEGDDEQALANKLDYMIKTANTHEFSQTELTIFSLLDQCKNDDCVKRHITNFKEDINDEFQKRLRVFKTRKALKKGKASPEPDADQDEHSGYNSEHLFGLVGFTLIVAFLLRHRQPY